MTDKEKVAQWMIQKGYATGHGDTVEDLLKELEWQILENWHRAMVNSMKAEREACAKVCDEMWHEWLDSPIENEPNKPDAEDCAKAIRARSKK